MAKATLDSGRHQYKLVTDGQWLTNPNNPSTTPDGFGRQSSLLQLN